MNTSFFLVSHKDSTPVALKTRTFSKNLLAFLVTSEGAAIELPLRQLADSCTFGNAIGHCIAAAAHPDLPGGKAIQAQRFASSFAMTQLLSPIFRE